MISSGYTPQGGNSLTTQGLSFATQPGSGGGGMPFDPTAAIREKLRREAEQTAFENRLREREMALRERMSRAGQPDLTGPRQTGGGRESGPAVDPLAAMKAQDRYDMSLRSAAMRPTGLGAQMIPGMAADPNLLPPRLRPQGSSFQGTPGPSMAGLSPSAPEPTPSSHRGFDFADPFSQAQLQRTAFSGRR